MPDREKVIIGLQCIIDGNVRCESCGYAIDKHGHHSCQQNCASDAIVLLKEKELKEQCLKTKCVICPHCDNCDVDEMGRIKEQEIVPVQKREIHHLSFFACGSCGTVITDGDRFCRMCGKKVKWNDRDNDN